MGWGQGGNTAGRGRARRAVVTGGAGFIGSHVAEALVADGWQVAVLDDLSTGRSEWVPGASELVRLRVESAEAARWLAAFRPHLVVHLAAQVSVSASVHDPLGDLAVNGAGTARLAMACREAEVERVVFASSAAVYGRPEALPLSESHPLRPISPYGISKLAGEHYLRVVLEESRTGWCVLRYANVYGPRQNSVGEAGVVAIFARELLDGRPLPIFGDGTQSRDFVFVGDVADATLRAATVAGAAGQVCNIGTGQRTSVWQLAAAMDAAWWAMAASPGGADAASPVRATAVPTVRWLAPRPGDIDHSCLDSGRAARVLGWSARTALAAGLATTLAFYAARRQDGPVGSAGQADREGTAPHGAA